MSLYRFSWLLTQYLHIPKLPSESQMTIICSSFSSRIEERVKHMSVRENCHREESDPQTKGIIILFSSKLSFSQTTITPYFSQG